MILENGKKIGKFIKSRDEFKELKKIKFKDFITGSIFDKPAFQKQIPFILYLAFLAFLYINNHYASERMFRDIAIINKEIKELKSESITTASEYMRFSKQSEVVERTKKHNLGLVESLEPPRVIE